MITEIQAAARTAERAIRKHVRRTATVESKMLSEAWNTLVYAKLENLQVSGSFKARGAFNKMRSLDAASVLAASTGNHGAAVAAAGAALGVSVIVYAPTTLSAEKRSAIESRGAEVRLHGADGVEAEVAARAAAAELELPYISPYNDLAVVAGQATIGRELVSQIGQPDAVVVATGGGGLISGIGAVLAEYWPDADIVAVSPETSAVMVRSLEAGRILELESEPTLSDGTAGGVETDALTFPLCQQLVDRTVLVSESVIGRWFVEINARWPYAIEGAAAAAVAGAGQIAPDYRSMAIIVCGGNTDRHALARLAAVPTL